MIPLRTSLCAAVTGALCLATPAFAQDPAPTEEAASEADEDSIIVTETREFSPVCPYSGLPDFATLRIAYVPAERCIELKSLKYYVTSFRSVGIFQEHATARIAEDLFRVLQPKRLTVTTIYNTRGGFDTTCTVELKGK